MQVTLTQKIREWILEAWNDQNPKAIPTPKDHLHATTIAAKAAEEVRETRIQMGITWQEAWSGMAPGILSTKQPSVAE